MNDEMKENEGGVFARKERAVERETAEATIPLFHGGDLKGERKRRERKRQGKGRRYREYGGKREPERI